MKVAFLSIDEDGNKVHFTSQCETNENKIVFADQSSDKTIIEIENLKDKLIFKRIGTINMQMSFQNQKTTEGFYANDLGLEFKFLIYCHKLTKNDKRIVIDYDLILNEEEKHRHKISLLFN